MSESETEHLPRVARDLTPEEKDAIEHLGESEFAKPLERTPSTATQPRKPEDFEPDLYKPAKKLEIQKEVVVLERMVNEQARSVFTLAEMQFVYGFMPRLFGTQWPQGITDRAKMAFSIVNELAGRILQKAPNWGFLDDEVREITISATLKQWMGKQLE
jgi:hypothetical protein